MSLLWLVPVNVQAAEGTGTHNFTILDYWQGKCDKGDAAACLKLEDNLLTEDKLDRLNARANAFRDSINPADFLLDDKPDLGKAYPLVIADYLTTFSEHRQADMEAYALAYCASHFHNYWLNKKYWWPTDIDDEPDWATIYVYVVDHYHGICIKQPF